MILPEIAYGHHVEQLHVKRISFARGLTLTRQTYLAKKRHEPINNEKHLRHQAGLELRIHVLELIIQIPFEQPHGDEHPKTSRRSLTLIRYADFVQVPFKDKEHL